MQTFRAMPLRRRLAAGALALSLIGTAVASLAVITDQLLVTNNYSTMTVDLKGNGTQAVTFTIVIDPTNGHYQPIDISNAGNSQLRYAMTTTATGSASITGHSGGWKVYSAASSAACLAGTPTVLISSPAGGTMLNSVIGSPSPGQQAGDRILAAGAAEWLCLITNAGNNMVLAPSDAATQTVTFHAENTAGNP